MSSSPILPTEPTKSLQPEYNWKEKGAPYVEPIKEMLGDKHLNPEEAVIRERQSLLKQCESKKIVGQKELEDHERSSGPRMPWRELIRRILICNPEIKIKDSYVEGHDTVALYRHKRSDEYTEADRMGPVTRAMYNIPIPKDTFFIDYLYVGGFNKEAIPEYAHVTLDTSLLPVREIRGWRSVLIGLIQKKAITYQAAVEEFGDPSGDQRSARWFEQLSKYRS